MVKDFKGQVKVADVQAAFDEIVGKVNSLVSSYNFQGSVEDIDYTIGGANLAPSGYTLSVGGMKQFLKACEGCVVGGKPFKVDDTHIKMSTGMVVSLVGIQRLPDSVLEVKGKTLWWDSYNKQYTWTGTVPRNDYFYFREEDGVWYTYLKKGTYTVTYRNRSTGQYEPKEITFNEDLKFPSHSFGETSSYYADILRPQSSGEVPISVITHAGLQKSNTNIETGYIYRANGMTYAGTNFSMTTITSPYVTITPKEVSEGLTNEELSYTFRIPFKKIALGAVYREQFLHFNIEVTRTNSDGTEETLDIKECRYDIPFVTEEHIATFSETIKLDKPLGYGETIDITISDIDSSFYGDAEAWRGVFYGIWGYESGSNLVTMDVHLHSNKTQSFTKKINLIVDSIESESFSQTNYVLDSVEGLYDNYSDLGYFTWDTKVYTDRPTEWSYVEQDSVIPEFKEISEGVYRVCDVNMNSSSKFVGTNANAQNEQIYGTYKITNESKDYTDHWEKDDLNNDRGGSYDKSPWYQELNTSKAPKFVNMMPSTIRSASKHGTGTDSAAFLFGEEVYLNAGQKDRAVQMWCPSTYLYVPKGVKNPYTTYSGKYGTDLKYSSQKVLNVKIDKQIKSENK